MKEGWEMKALKEVCKIKPPKKEARDRLGENDEVTFLPMNMLGIDQKYCEGTERKELKEVAGSYTYFRENDVLLAKITPCFENGKLGIANNLENGIGFGSSEFIVYRPSDEINREYLYYFLYQPSFRETGSKRMTGAVGHKRIPKDFYEDYLIPVPPIHEQKQIVQILDGAFAAIDKAKANIEKNIENAKELFQTKLNSTFDEVAKKNHSKKLGNLLETLTDYHANGSYKTLKKNVELKDQEDYAWMVRSTDFENDFKNNFKYIDEHAYNHLNKSKIFGGEIIISKIGNAGKVYVMPEIKRPCSLAMNLFLLRLDKEEMSSKYLYYYFLSSKGEKQILSKLKGATTKTITKDNVRDLNIPYAKLAVQNEKVIEFEKLRSEIVKLEKCYNKKLIDLEELKKSILQKAFAGELTQKGIEV